MITHQYCGRDLKFELPNPEDEFAQREFGWILQETFDMPTYDGFDFRGKVVIDAGAYVGETAILFSILGAKTVYAYEPSAASHLINRNAELNGIMNIRPYRWALGPKDGRITVTNAKCIGATKLSEITTPNQLDGSTINVVSLETLGLSLDLHDAILKMDIEGGEFDIITGASRETLRRFRAMFIESNDWYEGDHSRAKLIGALEAAGFKCEDRLTLPRTHIVFARRID